MSKLDTFCFTYTGLFEVKEGKKDIEVQGATVPECYKRDGEDRAFDDIHYAITKQKIIDIKNLKTKTQYRTKIDCRFIQNVGMDSFNQFFTLKSLEVLNA